MSENCEKNVEVVKVDEVKYFISGTEMEVAEMMMLRFS